MVNRAQVPDNAFNMIMQGMITNNIDDLQNGIKSVVALQFQGLRPHQNTKNFIRNT
jgi:hypothetical protein